MIRMREINSTYGTAMNKSFTREISSMKKREAKETRIDAKNVFGFASATISAPFVSLESR